ncbi:MAG: hypothetical protein GY788_20940 [bacterium]|nr:hypothetical protein [bacterium]
MTFEDLIQEAVLDPKLTMERAATELMRVALQRSLKGEDIPIHHILEGAAAVKTAGGTTDVAATLREFMQPLEVPDGT